MLFDLSSFDRFKQLCEGAREEMEEYRQDAFQSWSEDMITSLDDPDDPVRWVLRLAFTIRLMLERFNITLSPPTYMKPAGATLTREYSKV